MFPGPQKETVEKYVFRFFDEGRGGRATKKDIMVRTEPFALARDVLVVSKPHLNAPETKMN